MIQILLEGIPVSWLAHAGYGRRSFNPRFREKSYALYHIKLQYDQLPIEEAISICYEFEMPIPQSISKKKQMQMLGGIIEHIKRPDCTNMQKFYEDCLKGIVIKDDSQVVESIARKRYSDHPRTVISIKTMRGMYDGERESNRLHH